MSKYRNAVFYDFKSRFLVIFFSNYRHRLVLEIPFPDRIFPKISRYRTENLHFPSTDKYCVPLKCSRFCLLLLFLFYFYFINKCSKYCIFHVQKRKEKSNLKATPLPLAIKMFNFLQPPPIPPPPPPPRPLPHRLSVFDIFFNHPYYSTHTPSIRDPSVVANPALFLATATQMSSTILT